MHNAFMTDTKEARGKRLRQARERRYQRASHAAIAMKVHVQTYLSHEEGRNDFKGRAAQYARQFRVNFMWLWLGIGPMEAGAQDPILDLFDAVPDSKKPQVVEYMRLLSREADQS